MKTKMTIFFLVSMGLALVLLSGCFKTIPPPASETACTTDADCACGTHIESGACFAGNKAFVNVDKQCPDYCTGIAAMFETKCVDKNCKIVRKEAPQAECSTDADCVPEQCCHATTCIPASQKKVCNVMCTMECQPGTLDCGGSCTCESGKCTAHYLTGGETA